MRIAQNEEWRPVPGYGDYEVSNLGNVRSVDRTITYCDDRLGEVSRSIKGRTLNPTLDGKYRKVTVGSRADGTSRRAKVAILVLEAFVGPAPFRGAVSRHLNDRKADDRLINLAWGTHADNADDRGRNGRTARGGANGYAKLTEEGVIAIRSVWDRERDGQAWGGRKRLVQDLAERHNVAPQTIHDIIYRRRWRHIATEEAS